ncbi:TPA: DNA methyltransferase [Candidatus Gastranaerophilales bacterium HUM_2]|nr:MAG TPA: DNA methyltransferase [Candidatus Gastranaerophilales bacterium HUM_2]
MLLDKDTDLGIIQSPLNYTGGKFKLLPQILPLFPKNIDIFVDLFCGGANVGVNVKSNRTILNDTDDNLTYLFNMFKNLGSDFLPLVDEIIEKYQLSQSSKYGYDYYNCDSNTGLAPYNKDKFLKLRDDFNNSKDIGYYHYAMLYTLILYSFNNQIRFNSNGHFNLPVGKRDYNEKMKQKLQKFIDRLKEKDYKFSNQDFRDFDISTLNSNSFVYADPPYLITCATYNEQGGWNETDERDLLDFLNDLHRNNIKFALSNVLRSKGKENSILIDWIQRNSDKYKVINLNYSYNNSNYQTKNKNEITEEVLIINYGVQ